MRTAEGQKYSFIKSQISFLRDSVTNLGWKVGGWMLLGAAAGIGSRTVWNTFVDGKYTGNIVEQLYSGLKDVTPFVNGQDNAKDITTTLSAAIAAGTIYLGGKLLWNAYEKTRGYHAGGIQDAVESHQEQAPFRDLQRRTDLERATIAAEEDIGKLRATSQAKIRRHIQDTSAR